MECVILAAGPTVALPSNPSGFSKDSKPKCLFHYKGDVLLERQVRVLRKCGIRDIRVVVGYKHEMVEQFSKKKKLGLTFIYNPSAASDNKKGGWKKVMDSLRLGLKDVADDVLVSFGDVYLTEAGLLKVLKDKHSLAVVFNGVGFQLFKIGKPHLSSLRKTRGDGGLWAIHNFCMMTKGVKEFVVGKRKLLRKHYLTVKSTEIRDIDYYKQTDESGGLRK